MIMTPASLATPTTVSKMDAKECCDRNDGLSIYFSSVTIQKWSELDDGVQVSSAGQC